MPRSKARDVGMCALQMYAYLATYQMPNDDPEKLEARVRVKYPVVIDKLVGLGTTPTLRLQRALGTEGRFRLWEKIARVLALGVVRVPARDGGVRAAQASGAVPERGGAHLRDVRHRRDRLLGDPDGPAVVRGAAGPDGGRTHAGAAPDDGGVRRAVLEAGLGASVRCPGRQSPGRHAVAAFRHLRDGRACAERHRSCRGPARLDLRGHARPRARVPRRALRHRPGGRARAGRGHPRGDAEGIPRSDPARAGRCSSSKPRRGHDQRAGADGGAPPARRRARRRRSRPGVHRPRRPDAVRLPGRDDPRPLPAAAAARRPGGHLEPDRGRLAVLDRASRSRSRSACSGATSRCSAGSSRRSPRA